MATEIKMPQLSDTMDAGKIIAWNKQVGDKVSRGDILAEVETDKANLEIECFHEGTLLKIAVAANDSALVGEVIAVIGEEGESVGDTSTEKAAEISPPTPTPAPTPAPEAATPEAPTPPQILATGYSTPDSVQDRIKASPLARKVASQQNIDLSVIQGSGPQGRIIKKDLDNAATNSTPVSASTPALTPTPAPQPVAPSMSASTTELSKMRQTIARRMVESVTNIPHFYTTVSIDMSAAKKTRAAFKNSPEHATISINHMLIKAAAYALSREPRVNCAFKDNLLIQPGEINIGVITAVEDGLLIPIVKNADKLSLKQVAEQARGAIERCRAGKPTPDDLNGGTFCISNMGMFDVENFTAIINPGQGAIIAVGATFDQPVAESGEIVIKPIMKITLSVDHRIIDGVIAGTFLTYLKAGLETPALLTA